MRRAIYQLLPRGVSSCGVGQVQLKAKSSSAKSNWSSKIAMRCKRRLISAERQVQLEGKNSRAGLLPGMSRGALIFADGAAHLTSAGGFYACSCALRSRMARKSAKPCEERMSC